jgi:two-component system LytT family response regulator
LIAENLREYYPDIKIEAKFTSWLPALGALRSSQFDILFLDISIPGKNGIDLLKLIPNIDCEIIFITAHSEYAIEAIKFPTSAYILKPFDDTDFVQAVDRALERCRQKKLAAQQLTNPEHTVNARIGIPNNNGVDYISVNDILYIALLNKSTFVILQDTKIQSTQDIETFAISLADFHFHRVHPAYIVNLDRVKRYETTGIITMDNDHEIPIAKNLKDDFLKLFATVTKQVGTKKENG